MMLATNPLRAAGSSKRARMRGPTAPRTPALSAAVTVWGWRDAFEQRDRALRSENWLESSDLPDL
jgi:hypothetical protein